ncbi:TOBE domain-containing protein, partial [Roseovarius aestuarii]|nr:TOBE domain-containing protein [Roseovarius aestuarii]
HILAKAVKVTHAGEATLLSIRPEKIIIDPQSHECDNIVTGQLREVIYHGDHHRLVVRVADVGDLVVKVPNDSRGARAFTPGQE